MSFKVCTLVLLEFAKSSQGATTFVVYDRKNKRQGVVKNKTKQTKIVRSAISLFSDRQYNEKWYDNPLQNPVGLEDLPSRDVKSLSKNRIHTMNTDTPISHVSAPPTQVTASGGATDQVIEDSSVNQGHSNIQGMDATVFVDDANIVTRDTSHITHIDNTILSLNDTNIDEQSIRTFLARPVILTTGNFNITDTYSFLNSFLMPYAAIQATEAVMWREKLRGIFGIRMDMVFRIVINANRFQQGRYCLGWVPLAGPLRSTSNLKELAVNNSHMATLTQRTTVPHVEFDLSTDTVAELVVPYVSSRAFYPLNAIWNNVNDYPLGYLNLYPYSPLVSPAGSTIAGYTIYVSFTNVRFFGASAPQSGLSRRRDPARAEISNTANGPISSVSSAISKGFKEFGKVPMLSTYANSISWVADRITGVASIFGWSKPTQGDSLTKMVILQGANHNTVDGDSDARSLSYLSKPGVVSLDGVSATDLDEMDFSCIIRKPAYFLQQSWTTAAGVGSAIATVSVTPNTFVTAGGAQHYPPVAFVAQFFALWRGSIRYRLKFVRTEFHSGRLAIAFYPTDKSGAFSGNQAYVHRMIIDIRENQEVDFVVPFISNTQYNTLPTGSVIISVVDPLVCPATVSSTVTILLEIAGGVDMEFAVPRASNLAPCTFVPQSGLENTLTSMNIGNTTIAADPHVSSSIAIGDKITSFRAMLKRYYPIRSSDTSVGSLQAYNNPNVAFWQDSILGLKTVPTVSYIRPDYFSVIGSCYALSRGGVRMRDVVNKNMLTSTNINGPSMMRVTGFVNLPTGFTTVVISSTALATESQANAHINYQDIAYNAVVSAELPQYSLTVARSVCDMMIYQDTTFGYAVGVDASTSVQSVNFGLPISAATGVTAIAGQQVHNLYRALADDGDFSVFISVPAMISTSTTDPRLNLA